MATNKTKYVSQDVYNALKGIANAKNEYEYNDSIGNTAERDKYGKQATAHYDVLGAYSPELRATIKNSNAQQTRDLIKGYGVARDAKTITDEILANKHGYEKVKANGGDFKQYETAASALYDELSAVDPATATMLRNLSYQEALDWRNGKAPTNPTETYIDVNETLNKHGDNIYGDVRTMYFDENYGNSVRDKFTAYGGAKGEQSAVNSASDNGGNFDSFSEYNKNATNLAYQVAGENAVQRMREGYGNWGNEFLKTLGGELNTNAANFGDYEYKRDALEAEERMNTANNATQVYGYNTNYDIAQLEADAKKYGYDVEQVIAEINSEVAMNGYISQEKIAEIQANAKKSSGTGSQPKKPTLTSTAAEKALEKGEINATTVGAYNYYYGTNYTVDEMKKKYGYEDVIPQDTLTDAEIDALDKLTDGGSNPYGHTPSALGLTTQAGIDAYAHLQALYDAGSYSEIEMTALDTVKKLRQISPKDAEIIELIFLGVD